MPSLQALADAHTFWSLPRNAALHGAALDRQLLINLWIGLGLLTLAHVFLFGGLKTRRKKHSPIHTFTLEYIPLALLATMFIALAVHSHHLWVTQRYTGADLSAMQVEVTGMQFAWYFRYPGKDAEFGRTKLSLADASAGNPLGIDPTDKYSADDLVTTQLVLPANREVDLTLRSQDVMHGFSVPEMRLKQNAVPGQTVHIHFTPTTPGTYAILCTQVCGIGHYRMTSTLRVLSQQDFAHWLAQREAAQ